jgi:hypothetical protein
MNIELITINDKTIAEVTGMKVNDAQDALDLIGNCSYQGAEAIILQEEDLAAEFFDLKTGMAGEVLQKFSNYRMRLAIVGDFEKYTSSSLKDFIFESNRSGRILFVRDTEAAKTGLGG